MTTEEGELVKPIYAESEDDESSVDCERCGDTGKVYGSGDSLEPTLDCPNCTDESEGYDKPRPEDEVWRAKLLSLLEPEAVSSPFNNIGVSNEIHGLELLLDYINDLESELEDVREERDGAEQTAMMWSTKCHDKDLVIQELRQRIEEAREYVNNWFQENVYSEHNSDYEEGYGDALDKMLRLLNSDEGDA